MICVSVCSVKDHVHHKVFGRVFFESQCKRWLVISMYEVMYSVVLHRIITVDLSIM